MDILNTSGETASVDKIISATDRSHVFITYCPLRSQDKPYNLSTGLEATTGKGLIALLQKPSKQEN